eukprot:scaffold46014_cov15-Tisochrysis_lutea.AAC.1
MQEHKTLRTRLQVWLAAHEATLTGATHETGSPDPGAARKLLDRALTSLPKRKHIKVGGWVGRLASAQQTSVARLQVGGAQRQCQAGWLVLRQALHRLRSLAGTASLLHLHPGWPYVSPYICISVGPLFVPPSAPWQAALTASSVQQALKGHAAKKEACCKTVAIFTNDCKNFLAGASQVIVQTAMHEFKCPGGSAERGRGVLESVLRNHPKRIDLWSLYIDQFNHVDFYHDVCLGLSLLCMENAMTPSGRLQMSFDGWMIVQRGTANL